MKEKLDFLTKNTGFDYVLETQEGKDFLEVYVKCSLETCEERDPKDLYKKARDGQIKNFTGIDSPYEEPKDAEIVLDTDVSDIDQCVEQIIAYLKIEEERL